MPHMNLLSDGVNDPGRTENQWEVLLLGCCELLEMSKMEKTEQTDNAIRHYYIPHLQETFVLAACNSLAGWRGSPHTCLILDQAIHVSAKYRSLIEKCIVSTLMRHLIMKLLSWKTPAHFPSCPAS